jgi:hypothetical protein
MIDIIASEGWIISLLAAIEIAQMLIQSQWSSESTLLQIPHINKKNLEIYFEFKKVESIYELLDLDDKYRRELLCEFTLDKMSKIAETCNRY